MAPPPTHHPSPSCCFSSGRWGWRTDEAFNQIWLKTLLTSKSRTGLHFVDGSGSGSQDPLHGLSKSEDKKINGLKEHFGQFTARCRPRAPLKTPTLRIGRGEFTLRLFRGSAREWGDSGRPSSHAHNSDLFTDIRRHPNGADCRTGLSIARCCVYSIKLLLEVWEGPVSM